ncbi:hypothetical protein V1264_015592 [Littorina saxatilis]|uniref:DZANK-type domain-containing protein n=1 Tax=Littorina saxatilis TaxID=31220 RepID=A0AAN9GG58_9CAEN
MKCQGQVDGHECGRTLTPDVTFCPDCGTRREKNHTFTCLSCGKALEFGAKFCSTCGTRIDPNQFAIQPDICKGKNDDGSLCEYELIPGLNFCPLCGTKPGEQDVSEQGNQNSAVKRDVNPDVKIPGAEKISDSANGQLSDQPLCQVVKTETTLFNTERPEDETSTPGTAAVNAETDVNDETELPCKVHNDEVSAPVPCSEHPMEVEGSSGGEWHQHSQQCAVEEGEWESHFAEYANQPMVEKEIITISQTKLPLNNDPSFSQSCDQSKERSRSTSDSDSKPTSDGIRVYAAKTEEKTGNEAEDKENASNPNQAEIIEETTGTPVDHPLKAELDSATKTGTKEKHVEDKKAQSKGEGQCKNAAAGKGKANKEMAEKEQKNSSQSGVGQKQGGKGGNKSTEPKTKGDQSAGEQTKPKQPDAKKSYAQAASKTKAGVTIFPLIQ